MSLKWILPFFLMSVTVPAYCQQLADTVTEKNSPPATVPPKQTKRTRHVDIMNLTPDSGKAVVYIVRPSSMAFAIPMRIDCDSFQIGWISAKTFLYTMLDPGEHTFISLSENEFRLKLNLEPGKVYYIEEDAKMGWIYARTKLKVVDEEIGKKGLSKCTISGSNHYPKFPLSRDVEKHPPKN